METSVGIWHKTWIVSSSRKENSRRIADSKIGTESRSSGTEEIERKAGR